jgi:dienelactone hydrolase
LQSKPANICSAFQIVSLCSTEGTFFNAAAEVHPALVDRKDAAQITIPIVMLASQDEDIEEVEAFKSGLKVKNHVEFYADQVHGWMGAR